MALMPISQCMAWYLVTFYPAQTLYSTIGNTGSTSAATSFYTIVSAIACFYCVWALYNRYLGGNVRELGQYTMGILTICTYNHKYIPSMVATCLVVSNFLLPSYFILIKWNCTELARNVKNDTSSIAIVWAVIFKLYFMSNILLWSFILYKFYKLRTELETDYTELPISNHHNPH
jgi:hypothetical protein